jgi:hypothetical protein
MGYGSRLWREAGPQMAAPTRTDPIMHAAHEEAAEDSAHGNVAPRDASGRATGPRPPRWHLTGCAFSWKPHRRGLLQGEEPHQEGEGKDARSAICGHRSGARGDQRGGRPWLLRGLRLRRVSGPLIMKTAVGRDASWFFATCYETSYAYDTVSLRTAGTIELKSVLDV